MDDVKVVLGRRGMTGQYAMDITKVVSSGACTCRWAIFATVPVFLLDWFSAHGWLFTWEWVHGETIA